MERVGRVYDRPSSLASAGGGGQSVPAPEIRLRGRAFTLIEVFVIIGIIAILTGILIPVLSRARASSNNVACLANLRQISTAFTLYAGDNRNSFPPPSDPAISDQSWESFLKKYLPSKEIYHCQSDGGMFEKMGSSYDWRDTSDPRTSLAGRLMTEIRRPNTVLAFDVLPDWHAPDRINAVLVDGSAQTMSFQSCLFELDQPIAP